MGVILYDGWLTPALCQLHPEKTFVFGDNLRRVGMGGQAIIRNEPNALGVATKRKPAMTPGSFFEADNEDDLDAVLDDLEGVWEQLKAGVTVVIPVTAANRMGPGGKVSLGRERAELPARAPLIYEAICRHVAEMVDAYGEMSASGLKASSD